MFDRLTRGERSEVARELEPGRERQYAPGKQPLTARMGDGAHGAFRPELARVTQSMTELAIALGRRNAANVTAAVGELQRSLVAASRAVEHVRASGPTHDLATLQRVLDDLQRRSHALIERAAAATEPSSGPRALPEAIRGELESATGTSLAAVRVHSDAHGQRVAAPHGARAVAIGDDIYVADGQLDVASAEGRELLAHEVAHVVQSRAHAPVDTMEAAELEADEFAARFRTRGGAMSWSPATSVSAGTPMRAPQPAARQRDGQNASLDYQLTIAKQQDQNINAAGYLHLHFKEIGGGALEFLRARVIGTGHEQVTFQGSATSFLGAVFAALDGTDTMAKLTRLRHWLAPADLFAIVDRARPIFEPADAIGGHPSDALDYGKGPKGPALYRGAVGSAIASELERRVVESMKRMSARLVAVTARQREANQAVRETDLVNSHPLDVHVGRALVAHCNVQTGALDVAPGSAVTYRKVKRLEWMGSRGGPWNSVRSIDPVDANIEEMAAAVLGKSTEAYRLIRVGPYFLVPADVAAQVPEARSTITHDPARHAPTRLAFGPLAAAAEVAEAEHAMANARGASPSVPLQQRWQRIQEQLDAIGEIVRPYQLDGLLAPVRARHTAHKSDLATLAGRDAIVRAGLFDHQHRLLARVAAEIGPLIQSKSSAIGVALGRLVEVANLSHLAETGNAAFDRLKDSQRYEVLDVLDQHLGAAITQIELIRRVHRSSAAATRSKLVSGVDFQQRADGLAGQLAVVRSKLLHKRLTSDDASTAQLLMQRIDALRFEATLVAEVGQLATIADVFQQLGDQKWMQLTEHMTYTTGRLAMHKVVALQLRSTLEVVHKDWLAIQAAANLHAEQLARSSTTDAALKAAAKFQPALDAIRGKLHTLASDRRVRDFLIAAHDEIDDAQLRATIIQIAVLVGVAALSFGAGVVAEGVAVGMGTTALAGQFVGLVAESLTFSVISAALSDESILAAFASNFLGNLATFGALRLTKAQLAGSVIGKTLGRAKQGARVGTLQLWAVKVADVTAPMLVAAGVQFAQAEAESLIRTGRTLSMDELKASAVQGIAMMIGALVSHKLLAGPLDDAKAWGAGHGARRAQLARLKQLAAQVEASGDKTQAIELLHGARIHIEAELAKWNELSRLSSDELASRGLSKQVVDTMGKRASSHRTALDLMEGDTLPAQLALDALVPGHIYAGDPADVGRVVDSYRGRNYKVEKVADGYRITRGDKTSIKILERQQPGQETWQAFTVGTPKTPAMDFLLDPKNWKPERRVLHDKLVAEAKKEARAFADAAKEGEPTVFAMRGNTAAGKSRSMADIPELKGPLAATERLKMRSINPDNFKPGLVEGTPGAKLSTQQVHFESAMLAKRLEAELKGLQTVDGKPGSMLVDKRLLMPKDVVEYATLARSTGRKFKLYDVDAPLESSMAGVLDRDVRDLGNPRPRFETVADGFRDARKHRGSIISMFEGDARLGTYELFAITADGKKHSVTGVTHGKLTIHDAKLYASLLSDPEASVAATSGRTITIKEIDEILAKLPSDRQVKLRKTLAPYVGKTWREALDAHSARTE